MPVDDPHFLHNLQGLLQQVSVVWDAVEESLYDETGPQPVGLVKQEDAQVPEQGVRKRVVVETLSETSQQSMYMGQTCASVYCRISV